MCFIWIFTTAMNTYCLCTCYDEVKKEMMCCFESSKALTEDEGGKYESFVAFLVVS